MANPLTLEIKITNKDGKILVDVAKQLDEVGKKAEATGKQSQNLGQQVQRGFSVAQSALDIFAPSLSKLSPEFDGAIRGAQQLSGVVSLGLGFGPLGVLIAGATAGLGLYIQELQKFENMRSAVVAPYEKYLAQLEDEARGLSASSRAIADNLHITDQQAAAWDRAAQRSAYFKGQVVALAQLEKDMAAAGVKVAETEEKWTLASAAGSRASADDKARLKAAYDGAVESLTRLTAQHDLEVSGLDREADSATRDAAAMWGLTSAYDAAERAKSGYNSLVVTGAQDLITEAQAAQITENALKKTGEGIRIYVNGSWQYASDQTASHLKTWVQGVQGFTKVTGAATSAWDSLVTSMARGLITPSAVTPGDMAASAVGKYIDKWDEYARRMKDVENLGAQSPWAKLAPPSVLAQGSAALQAWAAAEEKAFYAGQRMGQVNTGAWLGDINAKIDESIGQWEMMNAAQAQVTEALKNLQRDDPLRYNKFLAANNLPVTTSAEKATQAVMGLKTKLGNLPDTTTTTLTAKTAEFMAMVGQAGDYLHDKIMQYGDSITIDIAGRFRELPTEKQNQHGVNEGFQHGGVGVFQQTGPVYVHAGEPYWIGGVHGETPFPGGGGGVTVVVPVDYHPYVSLSDREQFGDEIVPLIVTRLERELSRKFVRRG